MPTDDSPLQKEDDTPVVRALREVAKHLAVCGCRILTFQDTPTPRSPDYAALVWLCGRDQTRVIATVTLRWDHAIDDLVMESSIGKVCND